MKISDVGEFKLIERFSGAFLKNLPPGILGIGDDCAVIPKQNDSLLVTTDMLVENVHFLKEVILPKDVGYKSLAVNISDIAAMGGTPTFAFLSLALPKETEVAWVDEFFAGFYELAQETQVQLLGGDLTNSLGPIVVNITLLGKSDPSLIKLRSSAQPGDLICVTGFLGDSAAGLQVIFNQFKTKSEKKDFHPKLNSSVFSSALPSLSIPGFTKEIEYLLHCHHRPRPQVAEGAFLASQPGVHALIDVSDGIASDLQQIIKRSDCHAHILIEKLPLSAPYQLICKHLGLDPISLALTGGEDYCLLFTLDPKEFSLVAEQYIQKFGVPFYPIGSIIKKTESNESTLSYSLQGEAFHLAKTGFDHFQEVL